MTFHVRMTLGSHFRKRFAANSALKKKRMPGGV
jgi:hypothetical protein